MAEFVKPFRETRSQVAHAQPVCVKFIHHFQMQTLRPSAPPRPMLLSFILTEWLTWLLHAWTRERWTIGRRSGRRCSVTRLQPPVLADTDRRIKRLAYAYTTCTRTTRHTVIALAEQFALSCPCTQILRSATRSISCERWDVVWSLTMLM